MSDVFISYSRKDQPFVQKLHDALRSQERETWVDWDAIERTEDWWQAIERGIEGTNTFVFVISPDSIVSRHCNAEIDHAVKHNKRLVPIVYQNVKAEAVHEALRKLNWLFLRDCDPFKIGFTELIDAIDKDLDHVRAHTRILERAIEWEREGRNQSFELRKDDLRRAQNWLLQAEAEYKQPNPTALQREYISASQTSEEASQKAKKLVQIGSGVLVTTLIGAGIAATWAWRSTDEAKAGTRIERSGLVALRRFEVNQTDGLLLAMRSGFELQKWTKSKQIEAYPAFSPLLALQSGLARIRETKLPSRQGRVWSVALSPDATQIATAGDDGNVKLWNKNGTLLKELPSNKGSTLSVAFSIDGMQMVSGGWDGNVRVWSKDGALLKSISNNRTSVMSTVFSPDGARIAGAGADGNVKIWNKDGTLLKVLPSTKGIVRSVAYSPDGTQIATVGDDGNIKLWTKDGALLRSFSSRQGIISSIVFSRDGTQIATGGDDGSIKLWTKDGALLQQFPSYQLKVLSVAFNADGTQIASGGWDGSTKLWNVQGGLIREVVFFSKG